MSRHAPHAAPRGGRRTKRNNAGSATDDQEIRLARVSDYDPTHLGYQRRDVPLVHLSRRALATMGLTPEAARRMVGV